MVHADDSALAWLASGARILGGGGRHPGALAHLRPIDTSAADHYGVSSGTIGWLSEIVPLVYVFLALPAGRLLDLHFRPTLAMGAALLAAGAVVRLGGPTFAWALAGQALVAASQPFVLGAVAKLAGDYLPEEQRPAGIAIGASAGFAGMLFALLAGPTIGGHGQIERLLGVEAAIAVVSALALVWALRKPGPEEIATQSAPVRRGLVGALWSLPDIRAMARLVFVGFGIFTALMTWLQVMLEPAGISERRPGSCCSRCSWSG
jgi:predicted MFS family arabinose efflux permease